jgi:hypothetical protein
MSILLLLASCIALQTYPRNQYFLKQIPLNKQHLWFNATPYQSLLHSKIQLDLVWIGLPDLYSGLTIGNQGLHITAYSSDILNTEIKLRLHNHLLAALYVKHFIFRY